ncbi:MAG: hypothetical protein JOZ69_02490, partial [Myxococcales bacterium]|nr:hypothetical protein [Myxococcales bacterium]
MNHVRGPAGGTGLLRLGLIALAWTGAGCEQTTSSGSPDATAPDAAADSTSGDAADDGTGTSGDVGDDRAETSIPETGAGADGSAPDADSGLMVDPDAAAPGTFCALSGSIVWTDHGPVQTPGAASAPDLAWLQLPSGFCAHSFATVKMARQIRFAPDGLVFAASPTATTTGGANNGVAGIVVLPDDDHDGVADSNLTFLSRLPAVQGLMFANGYFYYQ